MQVRWTEAAAADFGRIADYLFVHAPSRAPGLVRSIYEAPEGVRWFPPTVVAQARRPARAS